MKKFLYMFLFATLVLLAPAVYASSEVYYTNNEGLGMTENQYNNLLNQGFTEKQIERMDYETFNKYKDIEATIVAQKKQYVKTTTRMRNGIQTHTSQILTEDEMNAEVQAEKERNPYSLRGATGTYYNGAAQNSYKIIFTTSAYLSTYDVMRYKLDTYWQMMPTTRSYDIIGIGIEAAKVQIDSLIDCRQDWRTSSDVSGYNTVCMPKTEGNGGSAMIDLPSGSLHILESYIYFTVDKIPGVNTVTSLTATGDYAHATLDVSSNAYNYYNVNYVNGIEIDNPYANSYDDMNEAKAYFEGTW